MNLENQHLQAIRTTKEYYRRKLAEETDKDKRLTYTLMIEDLNYEEHKILEKNNCLLDDLEKGDDTE